MPASRHDDVRKTGLSVDVLNDQEYEKIRLRPKTFEIHLATALFPRHKITAKAVARMVSHRIPESGNYNVIFHLRDTLAGVVGNELTKARLKTANNAGRWFLLPHHGTRSSAEARARKVIPTGSVSSLEIDAALAGAARTQRPSR